jgi:hypothetical protein
MRNPMAMSFSLHAASYAVADRRVDRGRTISLRSSLRVERTHCSTCCVAMRATLTVESIQVGKCLISTVRLLPSCLPFDADATGHVGPRQEREKRVHGCAFERIQGGRARLRLSCSVCTRLCRPMCPTHCVRLLSITSDSPCSLKSLSARVFAADAALARQGARAFNRQLQFGTRCTRAPMAH